MKTFLLLQSFINIFFIISRISISLNLLKQNKKQLYLKTSIMSQETFLQNRIIQKIDISHYVIDQDLLNIVVPGDLITPQQGYMNGHGTYREDNKIFSSLLGTVQITNKLIIVNAIKNRYQPQTGDIVVGKVVEIANKRWKIDINATTVAYLSLNNTYLPQQRKKNQQDQFNMRKIMKQGDLIVAEIHSINQDKTYNVHTRTQKYGKLQPGLLIQVPHKLIKRQKHHLITLQNIGIILSNNGNVYLSAYKRADNDQIPLSFASMIDKYVHQQIAKIGNILKILSTEGLEISELILKQLIQFANQREIKSNQILKSGELREELLERVRERIPKRIEEISQSLKKN